MFNGTIGVTELLLILAIVLLIFGPKSLPKLGRSIGRAIENFKKGQREAAGEEDEDGAAEQNAPKTKSSASGKDGGKTE